MEKTLISSGNLEFVGISVQVFKDDRKANFKFEHFFENVVVDDEVVEFL